MQNIKDHGPDFAELTPDSIEKAVQFIDDRGKLGSSVRPENNPANGETSTEHHTVNVNLLTTTNLGLVSAEDEPEPKIMRLNNLVSRGLELIKKLSPVSERLASRIAALDHVALSVNNIEQEAEVIADQELIPKLVTEAELAKRDTIAETKPDLDETLKQSNKELFALVKDLEKNDGGMDETAENIPANKDALEHKLITKIAKMEQFTQQQGLYLAEISKTFAQDLEALVARYKVDQVNVTDELRTQQDRNKQLESNRADLCSQIEKLKSTIKTLELTKANVDKGSQEQLKKIAHLEQAVAAEQELRQQADKRTQIAIQKARQYIALKRAEEKRRIAAEAQAKKAVMRAREVMSYFFSSTVDDSIVKVRQQQQALMGGLADFDDMLMFTKNSTI